MVLRLVPAQRLHRPAPSRAVPGRPVRADPPPLHRRRAEPPATRHHQPPARRRNRGRLVQSHGSGRRCALEPPLSSGDGAALGPHHPVRLRPLLRRPADGAGRAQGRPCRRRIPRPRAGRPELRRVARREVRRAAGDGGAARARRLAAAAAAELRRGGVDRGYRGGRAAGRGGRGLAAGRRLSRPLLRAGGLPAAWRWARSDVSFSCTHGPSGRRGSPSRSASIPSA